MSASRLRALVALTLFGLAACGGSGGGSSPSATPTGQPHTTPSVSPTRPAGTPSASPTPGGSPSILPPIVKTGRVVFESSNGERCCIAVDPALLPEDPQPGQASLVLDDLPIGPATVTIAGYTGDFAPAPPDVTATCKALNTTGVQPCDPSRSASAAYESDPEPVTIVGGTRVNLGAVDVVALPFVLDYAPPQNAEVAPPVDMRFTVVDAATGIAPASVGLEITLAVPQGEPPVFRPITKRVALELVPCLDGSSQPCSPDGTLGLSGFKVRGVDEFLAYLPAGPVEARITAQNLTDPPRDLDFRYSFMVLPQPTETPAATSTPPPVDTPTPSSTPNPSLTPSPSATATATASSTATPTVTVVPETPTPTETFVPVPTRTPLCDATPQTGCRDPGRAVLRIKAAEGDNELAWRWLAGYAPLVEFGDPTDNTRYGLCIYDSTNRVPALVFSVDVEAGACGRPPCWTRLEAPFRGYRYTEQDGVPYGVKRLLLRGGDPSQDSLLADAGGEFLQLPPPVSTRRYFAQEDDVIVQLVNDAGKCWQSIFRPSDVDMNLPKGYEATR